LWLSVVMMLANVSIVTIRFFVGVGFICSEVLSLTGGVVNFDICQVAIFGLLLVV